MHPAKRHEQESGHHYYPDKGAVPSAAEVQSRQEDEECQDIQQPVVK